MSMEETPKGDTHENFGEMPDGEHPSQFTCKKDFTGFSLEDLYIIEVCAGSARLSKIAHGHGFKTMAIDHSTARTCGFPICVFDLTDPSDLESLLQFIDEAAGCILMIWVTPPCGTSSRAREKKLPKLEATGAKVPVPLRSTQQPDQLDGLGGLDKVKVEKANLIYEAVYKIASRACMHKIFVALENPTNSHYWNTSPMKALCEEQEHHYVTFHGCAHGGARDKSTSLWVNDTWLDELALLCDGKHTHKPWTTTMKDGSIKFATAEEAAYPWLLCERIINCVRSVALQMGAHSPQTVAEQAEGPNSDSLSRVVLGALPRGHKVKPLVAEFGHYITVYADPQQPALTEKFVAQQPKGAKIVSRRIVTRGESQAAHSGDSNIFLLDLGHSEMIEKVHIGVPSEPDVFIQRAMEAGHPRSLDQYMDPQMEAMLNANFLEEPAAVAKRRIDFFHKYLRRAKELHAQEEELRLGMPEHVRNLVGGKRLLLWKEILTDYGYPDTNLIDEMAAGFKLSGWMGKSNVFRARAKRPSMSLSTLKQLSKALNATTLRSMDVRQEPQLEAETWEETVEEVKKGWIWFDEAENSNACLFIGRRFGIRQSNKTRVIDDCSCCGLNWTVGLHEKFRLQSIDVLVSMMAAAFKKFPFLEFPEILGRCYDLKSAYKQFPVHSSDRASLRMAVRDPSMEEPRLIGFNALPFGAVGSVASFLRVSMSVWYIGLVALQICWTSFYDDYSVLSRRELLANTSWCVESLFQLLGLKFATDGKKFMPFDAVFRMLGLQVDLTSCKRKEVLIGHTEERKSELKGRIDEILSTGKMNSKEAERLRGRMVFFEGYTFGRVANAAVKNLGKFCTGKTSPKDIDNSMRYSLLTLRDRVLSAPPVRVSVALTDAWLVFTDGACSPELRQGSIGGVILDPLGRCQSFFSSMVPEDVMTELFKDSENPIHELEVLPVLVACLLWGSRYSGALIVYYIDNESARMAYIKRTWRNNLRVVHDWKLC